MRRNAWATAVLTPLMLVFASLQSPCHAAELRTAKFSFEGRSVAFDTLDSGENKPVIILLHGASGPGSSYYQDQARIFADKGFTTIVLHYFDATKTSQATTENYKTWARLVEAMVKQQAGVLESKPRKVFLVGYSLGASVALAAGSQGAPVAAIAEWYGSLPDEFFYTMKGMPPLLILHGKQDTNIPVANAEQLVQLCGMKKLECESHIYPDQNHGFMGQALNDADDRTLQFFSKYAPAN